MRILPSASFSLLMISTSANSGFGRGAAVHAGVQIGLRALGFDLGVNQSAQADAQRRHIGREQLGVGDQREVGLQLPGGGVLLDVLLDALAAHFFFALDEHADVDGQLAVAALEQRLEGLELHPELAFVVDGAARVDVLIALASARFTQRAVDGGFHSSSGSAGCTS